MKNKGASPDTSAGAPRPLEAGPLDPTTIRIDRLLVYLRFARTRSAARALIEGNAMRLNRNHVRRVSEKAAIGDVLTIMLGGEVKVVKLLALPTRRAAPALAASFYEDLT